MPSEAGSRVEVVKSPQDSRQYRYIELANGMKVLLISDPDMAGAEEDEDDDDDESYSESESEEGEDDDFEEGKRCRPEKPDKFAETDAGDRPIREKSSKPAKKAAAALAVGVGGFSDPLFMQGMSHYLEHMLFMGSEKFPDENEYDSYLASKGGGANAFTEMEVTNFQLDVNPSGLRGALERFAQFFIAPLIKPDALEREVNAVDNEFSGVLQADDARLTQLRCHTSKDGHVFRKFTWGNRKSLYDGPREEKVDISKEIKEYYKKNYKAEHMALVVLGAESLDELAGYVKEYFSPVPRGSAPRNSFENQGFPFQGGQLHLLPSVRDYHEIIVTFQFPCLNEAYGSKADEYIAHLIGHEGPGSLLSALKKRGWVNDLEAGIGETGYDRCSAAYIFDVQMRLTDAGLDAPPGSGLAVVELLFNYISLLRREGPQKWVYDELAEVAKTKFQFQEEEDAVEYVERLASDMFMYKPPHILNGEFLHDSFDTRLIEELLVHMKPSQARIDVQTSAFERLSQGWKSRGGCRPGVEPWFSLDYIEADIPADVIKSWENASLPDSIPKELQLPPRNEFIATDFTLKTKPEPEAPLLGASAANGKAPSVAAQKPGAKKGQGQTTHKAPAAAKTLQPASVSGPALVSDADGLRVWHKLDATFKQPRAVAYFNLFSPHTVTSPLTAASTHLFIKLLSDSLTEMTYLADSAGLSVDVWPEGIHGLELKVEGFSHKLPVLTKTVFEQLANFKVDEEAFVRVKEALVRKYRNVHTKPAVHAEYLRLYTLRSSVWEHEAVLSQLEALTPPALEGFVKALFEKVHVEALVMGNLDQEEAQQLGKTVAKLLPSAPLPGSERPGERIVQLPEGRSFLHRQPARNPEEDNSVAEVYFQCGPDNLAERAALDMLAQVMNEPCYNVLRTKEQLGYSVSCGIRQTFGILGFCLDIVSGSKSPGHLDERIDAFLTGFETTLKKLPRDDFEDNREALIAQKLQKDRSLLDESDRHWEQIEHHRYVFNEREQEVAELQKLSKQAVLGYFQRFVAPSSRVRRRLAVHVVGRSHQAEIATPAPKGVELIGDLHSFADSLQLYEPEGNPLPKAQ
ncbi:hypothetical protein WJX84_001898 [Apatococcus fuscideae]|uniref:Insulin-degrading enzyme n=1 Tax=Apatococcus fuscideae TaxID=2026836 RepID=A0AAW1T0Z8_9CHLO